MDDRLTGKVKWFNARDGFGFIECADHEDDIFVHYSQIKQEGYRELEQQERVEFDVVRTGKGLAAHDVLKI